MAAEGFALKKALRLVLVGWGASGKSATGNAILGRNEFLSGRRSSKCVSQHAVVEGRKVTIVDTPGWTDFSLCDTLDSTQKEIISSGVPAPDAVLVLIPLHMEVTEHYIQSVTDHLSLLGDTVWSHTIVLFSFGHCLQNQTIEHHIEENNPLLYITGLCGNRYHVFDAKKTDRKQTQDLLIKIENLSLDNNLTEDPSDVKHFAEDTEIPVIKSSEEESDTNPEAPKSGGLQCFPELRVVLLGLRRSGKSSTGNTILGSTIFGEWTAKSQTGEAIVAGRRVIVIDTPPWQDSSISPDQNIVNCVCQCPPGPHALILVLNISSQFTLAQYRMVQRYIELLGERAWEHVIVIFTGADIIERRDMKSYLRNKEESLQMLFEKCGNRFYFFNNRERGNSTQVTDLLEGIEKLSSQHNPEFYEIDKSVAASMEEFTQTLSVRALNIRQEVAAKEHARDLLFRGGKTRTLSEVRIVLLGEKFSGKTFAAKTIANLYFKEQKNKCVATKTIIDDRIVLIVDTPGWSVRGQLTQKQETIREALSLCQPGPHAFLIVMNLKSNFTETHRAALEHNLACLPSTMWKNAMVLFTYGKGSSENLVAHIENEGEGENLKWLVGQCDNRYHVFRDTPFNDLPQVRELLEGIDKMVEANGGKYFSNSPYREPVSSEEQSGPMDTEDGDFEYTPREKKMMEKMEREIRERLLMEMKSYSPCAARSLPFTKPSMSQEQPASEDGIGEKQNSIDKNESSSGCSSSCHSSIKDSM